MADDRPAASTEPAASDKKGCKWGACVTPIAALILAITYLWFTWRIYSDFAMQEPPTGNWDHAMIIYNGITSVGFAAIGVLLGTQVQQTNVAQAQQEAARARNALKGGLEMTDGAENGGDKGGASPTGDAAKLKAIRRTLMSGL